TLGIIEALARTRVVRIELQRLLEVVGGDGVVAATEVGLAEQREDVRATRRQTRGLAQVRDRVTEQALPQRDLAHAGGRGDVARLELERLLEARGRTGCITGQQLLTAEVRVELGFLLGRTVG